MSGKRGKKIMQKGFSGNSPKSVNGNGAAKEAKAPKSTQHC